MIKNLDKDESGIIAIVVTIIVLIVITITVIGFAQIARREERQALDRQLSIQANYAAETGINDAVDAIRNKATNSFSGTKTSCFPQTISETSSPSNKLAIPAGLGTILGGVSASSEYTCLLINNAPKDIQYSAVPTDSSLRADFTIPTSAPKWLVIGWSGQSKSFTNPGSFVFPSLTGWVSSSGVGQAPVLRVDLTNITGANPYSRDKLIDNTYTGFFYPSAGGPNNRGNSIFVTNIAKNRGVVVGGECNISHNNTVPGIKEFLPQDCNVAINLAFVVSQHFLIRLKSIYAPARVTVKALDGPLNKLSIVGAQTEIDSTGKANDVLKRQQVRISFQPLSPDFAVQTRDSICKRLYTSFMVNASTDLPGDNACDPGP